MRTLDPRDLDHPVHLLQRLHHILQLTQIGTVEGEDVVRASVIPGATVGFGDVDLFFAEGLAHGGQDPRLIRGRDGQLDGAVDLGFRVPAHFDAALGVGIEGLAALTAVDGDAAAAGDEADDGVPGQRVTALGVADEHVVDAADFDAGLVATGDLADELFDATGADRGGSLAFPTRVRFDASQAVDDVFGLDLAVADGQ